MSVESDFVTTRGHRHRPYIGNRHHNIGGPFTQKAFQASEGILISQQQIFAMDTEKHHQTQAQLDAIEKEIKETQPLTSELVDLSDLLSDYPEEGPSSKYFRLGVTALSKKYDKLRKTRGDGNCYYRSFLYSLCETLLHNPRQRERIVTYVKESNQLVTSVGGYEEMAIEIFYDSLVEFLEGLKDATSLHETLIEENSTSDYCTWYLRVLTATYLKADPDRFLPYLEGGYVDIFTFCQQEIEPMGKECTMVQVLALAEAFQVRVDIEYLDGHEFQGDSLVQHSFGPEPVSDGGIQLTLLYRPGHYDILYQS